MTKMKKTLSFFIVCLTFILFQFPLFAAYLVNVPVTVSQPDGRSLQLFITGDEYYQRLHDGLNFTVVQDQESGYYVYARLENDALVPTSFKVGKTAPGKTRLQPGIDISAAKKRQIREAFVKATPPKPSSAHALNLSETTGTFNNIVVFVRFSDQTEFPSALTTYDNVFNNNAVGYNSMRNYFEEVSYEALTITSTFYPSPSGTVIVSYQDSHPRSYYMPYSTSNPDGYSDSERTAREHTLLANAIEAIDGMVPAGLDIDSNDDGLVDNVCFIIRGGTTAWSTLLWPHRWSLYSENAYINGLQVWDYNFQLEDFLASSGNGVLCHEMFHTLGSPDLYHYSDNGISPVGPWDIMENTANPPQSMGAWMKYKYGEWIASVPAITQSGTYTLNPVSAASNQIYKIASPNSTSEFFILEYREKTGTFENSIPASGLLIYRINPAAGNGNADGPPDEVYLFRPNGTPNANGSPSQACFSIGSGRTSFNDTTNPYGFLANGSPAGIKISNVGTAGSTISFQVHIGLSANFNGETLSACPGQTLVINDLSTGNPTSWNWSFTPGNATFVDGTTASSQHPHVQFASPGTYSVRLIVSNSTDSDTLTRPGFITILPNITPPYADDFESGEFNDGSWTIDNEDQGFTWTMKDNVGGNPPGSKCAYVRFYSYAQQGQRDWLNTPPLDLTTFVDARLTFRVAYRPYSSAYHDSLKVMIYSNCGGSWLATPYNKTGTQLATGQATTSEFTPSSASDWRTDTIDLTPYVGNVVMVKFLAVNDYGNNLYLDDVNITGTQVQPAFTASDTLPCVGATVMFTDQSQGNPTGWLWNFGDGSTSSQPDPTHAYSNPGTYTVSLTLTKGTASVTLTKNNYIHVFSNDSVHVQIEAQEGTASCEGDSVTIQSLVENAGLNPGYQWFVNGLSSGEGQSSLTLVPADGDQVSCIVTSATPCSQGSPAVSNTVTLQVIPYPSVNLGNDTILQNSCALLLDAGLAGSYLWSTGETTPTIIAGTSTIYSVTVTNGGTCQDVDSIAIQTGLCVFSGYVYYDNLAQAPLENIEVQLRQGGTVKYTTTTNADGSFEFLGYEPGTYTLVCLSDQPWGGVNSTDALLIMKHFVGLVSLQGVKLLAADVVTNGTINAVDALAVQKRFVGQLASFTSGDWVFEKPVLLLNGLTTLTVTIKGLCNGDVNGSYNP